nr:RNA-directed DNA polymerase, eukaryota [Tanacetum cinerariifolium]
EIGSLCITITDDYIDLSSNDNIKDVDTSSESINDHSVDDLEHIQTNLNNIVNQVFEQKMDNNEENKQGEEDIHFIVPQQPPKEEAKNKESNPECKPKSSDLSRPPGFEFMKKSSSSSSKCSISFARFRKKDIKGVSFIHELNQIINVGNSLGYDVIGLVDLPIEGRCFTWMNKAGTKLSKLDHFLILEDVIDFLPDIRITGLDRIWSDHNPILLHTMERNQKVVALKELSSIEKKIDEGSTSPSDSKNRLNLLHELEIIDKFASMDLIQKARVKWDIEGDENTKFFHCMDRDYLEKLVTHEEIKEAVWDCGSSKAPGPGGFSFAFVKKY